MLVDELKKLNADLKDKSFLDADIHVQALKDLKILCSKMSYNILHNTPYQAIYTMERKHMGDFLVLGLDMADKQISFPKNLIDIQKEDMYIAVVAYKKGSVYNAYIFKATSFQKTGLFSIYRDNKNQETYSIKLPDESKLKQYSFGYVLKNI